MGTVYTETKCGKPGCKSIDRIEGAFPDRMPEGWGEMTATFGNSPEIRGTICPKCVKKIQASGILTGKKKRADAGKPNPLRGKKKPVEQPATETKKASRQRKGHDLGASASKEVEDTTSAMPKCPGCEIGPANCKVKPDVASRVDCWNLKKEKGQIKEA